MSKLNFFNHFKTGIFIVLPVYLFVWIVDKVTKVLFNIQGYIIQFLPGKTFFGKNVVLLSIILVVILIGLYVVGLLYNHYYIGKRLKYVFRPIIYKIPILNSFYRVSSQISKTLSKNKSFKDVVLVPFPVNDCYSIGFITGDVSKKFEDEMPGEFVSVFIPTTPNPTNGFLSLVKRDKIKKIDMTVSEAIEYIISMGTVNIDYDPADVGLAGFFY